MLNQPAIDTGIPDSFYLIGGLVFGLSLLLMFLGIRGKRIDDHPWCRKCRFDLFGRGENAVDACPECGNDLTRPRAVRIGQRRKRRGVILFASFVMLTGVSGLGITGYSDLADVNWQHHKPVWMLMREADGAPGIFSEAAVDELLRREDLGRLNNDQVDDLIEVILRHQADSARAWRTEMGDLVEKYYVAGKLDRERWERYTGQFLFDVYKIEVRPEVVIGSGRVGIRMVKQDVRCGSGTHMAYQLQEKNRVTTIGPDVVGRVNPVSTSPLGHRNNSHSQTNYFLNDEPQWANIRPGKQKVTHEVELAILEASGRGVLQPTDVFASRQVKFETESTFLPAGQSTVKLNTDPSLKATVEDAVQLRRVVVGPVSVPNTTNQFYVSYFIDFDPRPVDCAFTIVLKHGANEYEVGSIAMAAAMDTGYHGYESFTADLRGKRVDVILRPSPDYAESTIDCFEIWGEDIVFKDVQVQ